MKRKLSVVIAAAGLLLALVAPMWAHHAFDAEFDRNKPIKLQGTVKKVEWINPHSWITIEVKKPDGTAETWEIESGPPNAMLRRGLNKNTLTVGTAVVVQGHLAVDSTRKRANGGSITFTDGRSIFLAGSNPADPANKR